MEITNFSARYESVFRPSQSGDVAFRFQLDGEVTLIINGEQVARKIYVKNPTNLYTLQAKAGKEYHIEIYSNNGMKGLHLILIWAKRSGSIEPHSEESNGC